jgi:hypothetical protein
MEVSSGSTISPFLKKHFRHQVTVGGIHRSAQKHITLKILNRQKLSCVKNSDTKTKDFTVICGREKQKPGFYYDAGAKSNILERKITPGMSV